MNSPEMSEKLLQAWLAVSGTVQNTRIVKDMTYNEAVICDYLWQQSKKKPNSLTATELCALTGMQKSLMNRTLKALIAKDMIIMEQNSWDHRRKPVRLNPEKEDVFLKTHNEALAYVQALMAHWDSRKAESVAAALNAIASAAKSLNSSKG
ncbi:MAG: MarR family transcriptional regulator [Oscillospiraceae bacterium]|nr:MarR family transcriptional regulator [Oscillospiraceae bacterium]